MFITNAASQYGAFSHRFTCKLIHHVHVTRYHDSQVPRFLFVICLRMLSGNEGPKRGQNQLQHHSWPHSSKLQGEVETLLIDFSYINLYNFMKSASQSVRDPSQTS